MRFSFTLILLVVCGLAAQAQQDKANKTNFTFKKINTWDPKAIDKDFAPSLEAWKHQFRWRIEQGAFAGNSQAGFRKISI